MSNFENLYDRGFDRSRSNENITWSVGAELPTLAYKLIAAVLSRSRSGGFRIG